MTDHKKRTEFFRSALNHHLENEELEIVNSILAIKQIRKGEMITLKENQHVLLVCDSTSKDLNEIDYKFITDNSLADCDGVLYDLDIIKLKTLINQHIFVIMRLNTILGDSIAYLLRNEKLP